MKKAHFMPFAALATMLMILSPLKNINAREVKAAGEEPATVLSAKEIFDGVYNNDLAPKRVDFFEYNVRKGNLSNSTVGVLPFDAKGTNVGDFTSSGNASVDWGGKRMNSKLNERVIISFHADYAMSVSVSISTANAADGLDNSEIKYYKAGLTFDESVAGELTPLATVTTFAQADLAYTIDLAAGETFYWEWGFQWDGWLRNFQTDNSGLTFTVVAKDEAEGGATSVTYNMEDVYKNSALKGGKNSVEGLAEFGMKFGDARINSFVDVTTDGEKYVTPGGNGGAWWQIFTANGEGFAFTFKARTRLTLTAVLTKEGDPGWIDAGVTLSYVVVRGTDLRNLYQVTAFRNTTFTSPNLVEALPGDTIYVSIVGDYDKRNLTLGTYDQLTFTLDKVATSSTARILVRDWLALRSAHNNFCTLGTTEISALHALITRYNALSVEDKVLAGRVYDLGLGTIEQGATYFAEYYKDNPDFARGLIVNESRNIFILGGLLIIGLATVALIKKLKRF